MTTKEQKRSAYALKCINGRFDNKVDKDYANFIVGMPTMILTNGLGQSLAFLLSKSKGEDKHKFAFNSIKEWLSEDGILATNGNGAAHNESAFLEQLAKLDQSQYIKAQRETLEMLAWLKRYARAFEGE